jgi:hypothetical protein
MRTKRGIVAIAALAFLAAGCSDEKPAAAPAPSSTPAPASASPSAPVAEVKEPCSLLSGEAVGKAIAVEGVTGKPGPAQADPVNKGQSKTCVFSADGKDVGALAATRYEGNKVTAAQMIEAIKTAKAGAVEVPGIGDGAIYYSEPGKTATFAAAKIVDGVPTLVNYTGPAKMTQEMMAPLVKQAVDAQ